MPMLDAEQIRTLICERLSRGDDLFMHPESLAHHEGIFRGMIWCLTGEDPGKDILRDVPRLLSLASIPYRIEADKVTFDLENKYLPSEVNS